MSGRVSPTPAQRRAADPDRSVWVTANAGTGKTRVLSDRVLRLLLAGARPDAILCLTFTKAAAAGWARGSSASSPRGRSRATRRRSRPRSRS